MCASFRHRDADGDERLERAIVLLLLADGRRQARSRSELAAELDPDPAALERALDSLQRAGVVELAGADARASRAARRIDELELIGI
jgi:predicted transcriptional regulator